MSRALPPHVARVDLLSASDDETGCTEWHWAAYDRAGDQVAYGTDFHPTPDAALADALAFPWEHLA